MSCRQKGAAVRERQNRAAASLRLLRFITSVHMEYSTWKRRERALRKQPEAKRKARKSDEMVAIWIKFFYNEVET